MGPGSAILPPTRWGARPGPGRSGPIANRFALPIVVLVLGFAGYTAYSQSEFGRFSGDVDAQIQAYREQRWERPPLRDVAQDGNAAAAIWEALGGFGGLRERERESLALSLHYGEPLSAYQKSLIEQEARHLAALRESGRLGWAMAELPVEHGLLMSAPNYPLVMDAVLLLLANGVLLGPDACLGVAADVVRVGQDLVPGAPLEAASVSARIATLAAQVAGRCAQDAGRATVAQASREFAVLAKRSPPVGSAIELHDLLLLVDLRARADLFTSRFPEPAWTRLWGRPRLFETAARIGRPSRWRAHTSNDYPAVLEAWRTEAQWRAHSPLPLVAGESAGVLGFLQDDMRGQAAIRATAVALGTLAERLRRGKIPTAPEGIADRAFADPFTGRQLRWRVAQDGSELTVWSVGEDLRDDKGIDDWSTEAPVDVVVHVGFRPIAEIEDEERKAQRRPRKRG